MAVLDLNYRTLEQEINLIIDVGKEEKVKVLKSVS